MTFFLSFNYLYCDRVLQTQSSTVLCVFVCVSKGPVDPASASLPEILCVVQFAFEGEISRDSARHVFANGMKVSGDM